MTETSSEKVSNECDIEPIQESDGMYSIWRSNDFADATLSNNIEIFIKESDSPEEVERKIRDAIRKHNGKR